MRTRTRTPVPPVGSGGVRRIIPSFHVDGRPRRLSVAETPQRWGEVGRGRGRGGE